MLLTYFVVLSLILAFNYQANVPDASEMLEEINEDNGHGALAD